MVAGLRCIYYGSPSPDERITENGFLSLEKLDKKDNLYAEHVRRGLRWKRIRWQVEAEFPEIMKIVQEAGNASHQIANSTSRPEILYKIHGCAVRLQKLHHEIDWDRVVVEATRGAPPAIKPEIKDLCDFVKHMVGVADTPEHLDIHRDFLRGLKNLRDIGGEMYGVLGRVKVGGVGGALLFRWAILKA